MNPIGIIGSALVVLAFAVIWLFLYRRQVYCKFIRGRASGKHPVTYEKLVEMKERLEGRNTVPPGGKETANGSARRVDRAKYFDI